MAMSSRRFKRYPAYRESGVEWLGRIPAHWEVAPVYARYDVALGKMLDSKRVTGKHPGRYLRNVDVQWDAINTEALPEMDFVPEEQERYALRAGDLLVCEGGEVGRTAIWRGDINPCYYQKALHRVRALGSRDIPRFFYYVMRMVAMRAVFSSLGNQNTIDHLTATQLRHYRLAFAPANEQRAIVGFLDRETTKIDGLIARHQQLIELLREKRISLITRAVTKGLNQHASMKDSGIQWLGDIPQHWHVKRLKALADVELSNVDKNSIAGQESVRLCNYTDVYYHERITKHLDFMRSTATSEQIQRFSLRAKDVLITKDSESWRDIAVPAVVDEDLPGVLCGYHLAQIRSNGCVNGPFLSRAFSAIGPRDQFHIAANGITRFGLTGEAIRTALFAVPPKPEQDLIAEYMDVETARVDTLIEKIQTVISDLGDFRTTLISDAVSGQIDVREDSA
jgi:type I restriction enzyme, S subunit